MTDLEVDEEVAEPDGGAQIVVDVAEAVRQLVVDRKLHLVVFLRRVLHGGDGDGDGDGVASLHFNLELRFCRNRESRS